MRHLLILLAAMGSGEFVTGAGAQEVTKVASTGESPPALMVPTSQAIAMFESRVAGNQRDVGSRIILGQLYMRQAKEQDDFASFSEAEKQFQTALTGDLTQQVARTQLATALLAMHRFSEALRLAEKSFADNSRNTLALATIGDAHLELGDYVEADQAVRRLYEVNQSPPVLVRVARLREIQGDRDGALELMHQALAVQQQAGANAQSLAWYAWRLAGIYWDGGDIDQAHRYFKLALECNPQSVPALAGSAKVLVARGNPKAAVAVLREAIARSPEPPLLIQLGDLLVSLGNTEQAVSRYLHAADIMAQEAREPVSAAAHQRERAMFFCDHDQRLEEALEIAKADLTARRDVYAYDLLAWAHYKNGNHIQAVDAVERALAHGTRDASIFFHAGMIYSAAGNRPKAVEYLSIALITNPHFSTLAAPAATAELAKLTSAPAE